MSIPESIKSKRPTQFGAVEIRLIGGHYYTYLVSSKWDADKGRPQKVTGKSIGKITEADGFIPNANGMRLMKELRLTPDVAPAVKNYGAYETLQQLSPDLDRRLREYFPDIFHEIRTISLLRLVDSATSAKMIGPLFLDSYMSDICSDISVSEGSVRRFISRLGAMQDQLDTFMPRSTPRTRRRGSCMSLKKTPTARSSTVWCRAPSLTKPLFWIRSVQPDAVTASSSRTKASTPKRMFLP